MGMKTRVSMIQTLLSVLRAVNRRLDKGLAVGFIPWSYGFPTIMRAFATNTRTSYNQLIYESWLIQLLWRSATSPLYFGDPRF